MANSPRDFLDLLRKQYEVEEFECLLDKVSIDIIPTRFLTKIVIYFVDGSEITIPGNAFGEKFSLSNLTTGSLNDWYSDYSGFETAEDTYDAQLHLDTPALKDYIDSIVDSIIGPEDSFKPPIVS